MGGGGQWGTEKMRGKRLSFSSRPACVGLSRTLMEFPACLGAICICPTRLMSTLLLIFESDLPTTKHEFWPIYILLQRSRTSFSPHTPKQNKHKSRYVFISLPSYQHEHILIYPHVTPVIAHLAVNHFDANPFCSNQSSESNSPAALEH